MANGNRNRKTPTSVIFKPKTLAAIRVIALESRRSIAWTVADIVDLAFSQPFMQEKVQIASRAILSVDPTYGPALLAIDRKASRTAQSVQNAREVSPAAPSSAVAAPKLAVTLSRPETISGPAELEPAPVKQPVFVLDSMAPTNELPLPAESAPPAPVVASAPKPALKSAEMSADDWADQMRSKDLLRLTGGRS